MTAPEPVVVPNNNNQRNHKLYWLTLILLLLGLGWFLLWYFYLSYYESTDDAYVDGNQVNVTAIVSGVPTAFYADDTDLVKMGQLLVKMDDTPYRIKYHRELDTLANVTRQVQQLYDTVEADKVTVESKKTLAARAKYDFENRQKLVGTLAVSNEDFIHARDSYQIAQLEQEYAEKQLILAQAAAGTTEITKHPLIEAQKNAVREAFYELKHTLIYAPVTGYIAQRNVEVGQSAAAGKALMSIVPIDYMWVDANFKETQLSKMRIGQPAKVTIDLYGDSVDFKGKVLGIGMGTGSVFSLIPPQNATGNWIKIVQRVPVRISLDEAVMKDHPLRLGLSGYVTVDIADTERPMLPLMPHKQAISTTNIFHLDFSEVNQLMDKIIAENINGK